MKIEIDGEADAAYITLKEEKIFRTPPEGNNVIIDVDKKGNVLGIEILDLVLDKGI